MILFVPLVQQDVMVFIISKVLKVKRIFPTKIQLQIKRCSKSKSQSTLPNASLFKCCSAHSVDEFRKRWFAVSVSLIIVRLFPVRTIPVTIDPSDYFLVA